MVILFAALCLGGAPAEAWSCLRAYDLPCAEAAIADQRGEEAQYFRAQIAFYRGDAAAGAALLEGLPRAAEERALMERTAAAQEGWVERREGGFVARYHPGLDAVVAREALAVMQAAHRAYLPILGDPPPGPTVIEIYPLGSSFISASSLTKEEVETTGTVALSKWSRTLLTSPRALASGYGWQDTLAHEYVHTWVTHRTHDRTPVWLQEAFARYLDNRWRDGRDHFAHTPRDQGLLARAQRDGDFVSFEEMHPSFAKLPSAERAALAYAQVASLMQFAVSRGGDAALGATLDAVDREEEPTLALARAAGFAEFSELEAQWRAWLARQPLADRGVGTLQTVLGGGDAMSLDPSLAARADLQRRVRLGDLLAARGAYAEALLAYGDAPVDSPYLRVQVARAQRARGADALALGLLEGVALDYPEYTEVWRALAEARRGQGAALALERVLALSPTDLQARRQLVAIYTGLGQHAAAARHAQQLDLIGNGGYE